MPSLFFDQKTLQILEAIIYFLFFKLPRNFAKGLLLAIFGTFWSPQSTCLVDLLLDREHFLEV